MSDILGIMKQRFGTAVEWATANPVLLAGEFGLENGSPIKIKIGDGATPWATLPYWQPTSGAVSWSSITGVPVTFAPSAHTHTIANISGLQGAISGKLDVTQRLAEFSSETAKSAARSNLGVEIIDCGTFN